MNNILLGKAGEKVGLQLDGTKVVILENNNPHIGTLYISDNNTPDEYDIRLKYKEQLIVSSTVYIYHLNPQIKGRIKFVYKETTQSDKILKDFSNAGGNSSARNITLIEMHNPYLLQNNKWNTILELYEDSSTDKKWFNSGVLSVPDDGYYNIKLTIRIDRHGNSKNKLNMRLIDDGDVVVASVATSQLNTKIYPSLSIDKTVFLQKGNNIRIQVYQDSGNDLDLLSSNADTFGSIEKLDIAI